MDLSNWEVWLVKAISKLCVSVFSVLCPNAFDRILPDSL